MHIFGSSKAGGGGGASTIPYVTERDFEQQVLRAEKAVLLYFTADWCQPCKTVGPEVEKLATEVEGKLDIFKVDVDKSPALAQQLRIQSVPTFMLFYQGRLADVMVGALGKKQLREMIEPVLPRAAGLLKARELAELLKQGVITPIDVRDAGAFNRARLPGAKSLPADEIEGRLAELFMLPGQPAIYDRSGDKVEELAKTLEAAGAPVAFLEGGILAWESEGLPVER